MTLRRFDQFQFGPLNAARMNEMVDAIVALQRKAAEPIPQRPPLKDTIVAVILGEGVKLKSEDCEGGGQPAVMYEFREVGLKTSPEGAIGSNTCLNMHLVDGGVGTDTNGILFGLEVEPSLKPGDVVMCHRVGESYVSDGISPKVVYIASTPPAPSVNTYIIIGASSESSYIGVRADFPGTGNETIVNLYEESDHYGADDDPQNECATLTPRRLRAGDRVFGYKIGNTVYTCAPTAWTVECLPCGPSGITPLNIMDTTPAKELMAADTVLRGR